jgi:hypothetical protein
MSAYGPKRTRLSAHVAAAFWGNAAIANRIAWRVQTTDFCHRHFVTAIVAGVTAISRRLDAV